MPAICPMQAWQVFAGPVAMRRIEAHGLAPTRTDGADLVLYPHFQRAGVSGWIGGCRVLGWVRAGESRGASQGVGEAVWLAHTRSRQRRLAARICPSLRVAPARRRMRRCKCSPDMIFRCALGLACTPLQTQRGPNPKPDSLPDKGLPWPHKATSFLDSVIVLAPNPLWVQSLPNGKLPEHNDFVACGADLAGRVKAWNAAASANQQLADEFAQWLRRPDTGAVAALSGCSA